MSTARGTNERKHPKHFLQAPLVQVVAVLTLVFFFLALLAGFLCVQPQEYQDFPNNLDEMRKVLASYNRWKALCFRTCSVLFGLDAFCFAGLSIMIIH